MYSSTNFSGTTLQYCILGSFCVMMYLWSFLVLLVWWWG